MVLATADAAGKPSARVVLLKEFDERGFVFFTNYESRKARELAANRHAALNFFWAELERQVCVTGSVTQVPREEAEAYFKTRPRGSRLGAWASKQSETVPSREVLEARLQELEKKYPGEEVPLPPFWGGYVLAPREIDFYPEPASRVELRLGCQTGREGAKKGLHLRRARRFAHQTDAPDLPFERPKSGPDLDVEIIQQALADPGFVHASGNAHGIELPELMAFLRGEAQLHFF